MTTFPSQFKGPDFDIIMLNICSLSWDDLSHIGLDNHPFMNQFDVLFTQFNSATSYSGPAATRLLNASCGHLPHDDLYGNKPKQCNLFGHLEQLGFQTDLAMNHNGFFDNFLQIIQTQGGISAPLQSLDKVKVIQRSFDGSPIYSDSQVLAQWLKKREQTQAPRHALYFNSISLHDGNLIADKPAGFDSLQSYGSRTQTLFNDLDGFFKSLTKTGKNYLVVMVPEHGAALKGDRMQFSGLREIPSPSIINVPVGIKFIGPNYKVKQKTIVSSEPVSYLALSELLARVNQTNPFESPSNLATLLSGLPTTPVVAENSGVKMLMYSGQPYVQLDDGEWQRYPN
jgi:cellulose synthase operon protein YhjU